MQSKNDSIKSVLNSIIFLRILDDFLNVFNVQKLGAGMFKVLEKLENIGFGVKKIKI